MVKLGRVSRSGFYRFDDTEPGPDPDMDLRDAIQKIAVEWPAYGRPRVTRLRVARARVEGESKAHRPADARGQPAVRAQTRKFVVTTDSNHTRKVYPNLALNMVLTAINQHGGPILPTSGCATSSVFLAVILDAYSRRVISWALDRTMEDSLTLTALRVWLLARRAIEPGGASLRPRLAVRQQRVTPDLLKANGIEISMSRKGNPWINAACESFMKTLKYEEVLRNEYRDLADARASIREFLEKIYSQKRLHSALGYVPPARFEKDAAARRLQYEFSEA